MTLVVDPFQLAADILDPEPDEYQLSMGLEPWRACRRPNQAPPTTPRDWYFWLILAGRGWGKTRTGAEWLLDEMTAFPHYGYAMIGPTFDEGRDVMVEGESGLEACADLRKIRYRWNKSTGHFQILGGAKAELFTAEKPDGVRGPNLRAMWGDEPASWRYGQDVWDTIQFALRKGDVRACLTGTPKATEFVKFLISQADVITKGHSDENRANLSEKYYARVIAPYVGTRLGRQELAAEILEDVEGALLTLGDIEADRVMELPTHPEWSEESQAWEDVAELADLVVAIDPAVTANKKSDETGIVCGALGQDGDVYILADRSCKVRAERWARVGLETCDQYEADRLLGEVNNGGDLVEITIRNVAKSMKRPMPLFRSINASRGKQVRAEPVAAMYEQHRVHHVGYFPKLEDEWTGWIPGVTRKSPNRLDAGVYVVTDLLLQRQGRKLRYSE